MKPLAMWSISLDVDCPGCGKLVDLLRYADFWDGRKLAIGESSEDEEVKCPKCGHEFSAEIVY